MRLFVAIRPPRLIRERLLAMMGGVSGARWRTDDQLHLTLRFIGEADRHLAADVAAALAGVSQAGFEIRLDGLGWFDARGRPETLWAGVTPEAPLKALHKKIDRALDRIGVPPDRRAFAPHITLARLKSGSGPLGGLLEQLGGFSSQPFAVDSFGLYESDLTPDGAVYSLAERYRLL